MRLPPNDLGGLKIPFDETPSEPKKFPGICLRQLTRKFSVCGVRVEDIKEPTMREIRYLDKLIDELARGKVMETILRQ